MEKQGKFELYSVDEFDEWLAEVRFHRVVHRVQNHHTWIPNYSTFSGDNHFRLLQAMENAHLERGFAEIAQNLTTFPDGTVAVCRSFENIPAGIKGANTEGLCIEHVGNFDAGHDHMNDVHAAAVVRINALLCREFGLTPSTESVVYHHWWDLTTGRRTNGDGSTKTCPGSGFFGGNSVASAESQFIPRIAQDLATLGIPAVAPAEPQWTGVVTASALNVRSEPSSRGSKVGRLLKGIRVGVYEGTGGWYRVHPSESHWVYGRYLRAA